jgi:hypothetical protein
LEGLERVLVGRGPLPNDRDVFVRVQDDFRTPADLQMEARTMVQTTYYPENCPHYKEILLKVYGQLEDPAIRGTMCQVFSIDDL